MNKLYILILGIMLSIFMIGLVSAGASGEFIGSAEQGDCFVLKQECASCTYSKISAVIDHSGNISSLEQSMTKSGVSYNYSQCGNLVLGRTDVIGHFDVDGIDRSFHYWYEVTPNGASRDDANSGLSIIVAIVAVMFLFGFIGFKLLESAYPQIGYLLLALSAILAVVALFNAWTFTQSLSNDTLSSVQFGVFNAIWLVMGFVFLIVIIFILYNYLKNMTQMKEQKKYGEGYNTQSKQYEY